jgi:hypothetical protein
LNIKAIAFPDNRNQSSTMRLSEILTVALVTGATAYDLPNNLKQIYDKHKVYPRISRFSGQPANISFFTPPGKMF